MTLKEQRSGLFKRIVSSSRSSFAFSICLLLVILAYRVQLTKGLLFSSVKPFDFDPRYRLFEVILSYLPYDLSLVLACFLIAWLLSIVFRGVKRGWLLFVLWGAGWVSLNLAILVALIIHGAHIRLLFDAQTGLTVSLVKEVWMNIPFRELVRFITPKEASLLLVPIALFWMVLLLPLAFRLWMARVLVVLLIFLSMMAIWSANTRTAEVPPEIRSNPALFLLSDFLDHPWVGQKYGHASLRPLMTNEARTRPTGPSGPYPIRPRIGLPPRSDRPWNVILFVMESVGTRYAFDTNQGPMPMPFLHQMSKEGWYLKNHFTAANISNKALFSLLSGLYDFFNRETFCIRPDASVPSLYNFLAGTHESFLVTPTPITWYFPSAFVKNSGLPEIHSYDDLKLSTKEEYHSLGHYIGRDEVQTIDFFIRRLDKVKEPFLGIYCSFAAHLPYFDYGPDYRVRQDDGRAISRYYNNLNLLDHMIKRIYDNLKEKGLLERTIFVIVGDHGQAFGQHHPDNFMHYRYSYNENLEAPAIFYQPALFKPRIIDFPTSHVDLLPTLLDAMRVPHDPDLFEGESLFQNRLRRRYIFFYGYEESISCLDHNWIKVQYSLKKNQCQAFDLKVDPGEKTPLDCSLYQPQLEALHEFVNDHNSRLLSYNLSVRRKEGFQGHKHPGLLTKNKEGL